VSDKILIVEDDEAIATGLSLKTVVNRCSLATRLARFCRRSRRTWASRNSRAMAGPSRVRLPFNR